MHANENVNTNIVEAAAQIATRHAVNVCKGEPLDFNSASHGML